VVQGRSETVLSQWIDAQPQLWREHVSVAALDPFRGYATALRTSLPHAIGVLDAFHVTRLGFAAVDDVRRRVQQQSTGHRGRRDDPLFKIRRLLRRGHENLTDTAWDRLSAGLQAGDVDSQIQLTNHTGLGSSTLSLLGSRRSMQSRTRIRDSRSGP
jgi:transposase